MEMNLNVPAIGGYGFTENYLIKETAETHCKIQIKNLQNCRRRLSETCYLQKREYYNCLYKY